MKVRIKNPGLRILSVLFAAFLWFIVVSIDDPITSRVFSQIPVEMINTASIENDGNVYEVADGNDTASVTVTAKRSVLDSLSRDNFKAVADMSKLEGNLVPIEVRATRYADKIENISLRNKNMRVIIEALLEKQLTIVAETEGVPSSGYVVGDIQIDKNIVKISGPESEVEKVSAAFVILDVADMKSNISTSEAIQLRDDKGDVIRSEKLTLSRSDVNVQAQIWATKDVPLSAGYVGTAAEGYGATGVVICEPLVVTVAASSSVLDSVASITLPSSLVDITGATDDVNVSVSVKSYIPDGLMLVCDDGDVTADVYVEIASFETRVLEVPTANINAVNIPDGMSATVGGLGEVTAVSASALPSVLPALNPALITGSVDLSAIEPDAESGEIKSGIYEVPVTFTFPAGVIDGGNSVIARVILARDGEEVPESDTETAEDTDDSTAE